MGLYEHFPYVNFHELNLNWIIEEMGDIKREMAAIEAWKTDWDGTLEELEARYDTLTNLYASLLEQNEQFKADINSQFAAFESTMNIQYQAFENTVNSQVTGLSNQISSLSTELDNAINNLAQSLTMINPFTGEKAPLTDVINMLAAFHMADALTAQEYDSKQLTASAYDALDLTAYQYDVQGSLYIN